MVAFKNVIPTFIACSKSIKLTFYVDNILDGLKKCAYLTDLNLKYFVILLFISDIKIPQDKNR